MKIIKRGINYVKKKLEKYLGKYIGIRLFDGDVYNGYLCKSGNKERFPNDPNLYVPRNYYFLIDENDNVTSCLFRCSHVARLLVKE